MTVRSIQMVVKIAHFWLFVPGFGPFTGIQNIKLNKRLYLTHSTFFDKHDFDKLVFCNQNNLNLV